MGQFYAPISPPGGSVLRAHFQKFSACLIERLWGHLKRTVLANVFYKTLDDLVQVFRYGVRRSTVKRENMGFMFDHDDMLAEIANDSNAQAA